MRVMAAPETRKFLLLLQASELLNLAEDSAS